MSNYPGFSGSPQVETSIGDDELVQTGFVYHKFSFLNLQDCQIKVNGSDEIFLNAGQGFATDEQDVSVKSFVIVQPGIKFNWVGSYRYVTLHK